MEKTSSDIEGKMFLRNATGLRREVSEVVCKGLRSRFVPSVSE